MISTSGNQRAILYAIASFAVILLVGGGIAIAVLGGRGKGKPVITQSTQAEPEMPRITIGKDTTHIDGPLDKDGNVDYVAAMNAVDFPQSYPNYRPNTSPRFRKTSSAGTI